MKQGKNDGGAPQGFRCFPREAFEFLLGLRKHNNREWFQAHAAEYEAFCLEPAKRFVEAVGPELRTFMPGIRFEPRVLGSIFRITRDTRYANQDRLYKDHIDFYFWEGERRRATSGLFARLSPDFLGVGAGCHRFEKDELKRFREALNAPRVAADLAEIAREVEKHGYKLKGDHYKRIPSGLSVPGPVERFALFDALYVHVDEAPELALRDGAMLSASVRHWRALADLHRWLTAHVQSD
ncbi:DUF2461 family protein [Bradyrhizobium elkanii]|uniref:DUF2461 family protein n=1 Tax=Bradyrhizobium elkanii TaxID=29448 RepID=UPI001BA48051|nr:DUF2461 domain-containing protein [Bradyrhizobium elkanii]MBR1158100.1 DUF2461 domain-containing protein [Bradyrhizobium elkanii]